MSTNWAPEILVPPVKATIYWWYKQKIHKWNYYCYLDLTQSVALSRSFKYIIIFQFEFAIVLSCKGFSWKHNASFHVYKIKVDISNSHWENSDNHKCICIYKTFIRRTPIRYSTSRHWHGFVYKLSHVIAMLVEMQSCQWQRGLSARIAQRCSSKL